MSDRDMADRLVETRDAIDRIVRDWVPPLGLKWWRIEVDFVYSREPSDREGYHVGARTNSNWPYREAYITFFLPVMAELDDEDLEEYVLHELVHILVSPMQNEHTDSDMVEFTVTGLQRALMWMRDVFGEQAIS